MSDRVEPRRSIHAYMSDQAHESWHLHAAEWGVSVSALLEALAPQLAQATSSIISVAGMTHPTINRRTIRANTPLRRSRQSGRLGTR